MHAKPFAAAAAATILLSFAVCFVLTLLGRMIAPENAVYAVKPYRVAGVSQVQEESHPQEPGRFINQLKEKFGAAVTENEDGYVTARLQHNLLYRLHSQTTFQELATTDEALLAQLKPLLDEHGIEYAVFRNEGEAVLLNKNEWVISWGGILYVPQPAEAL